MNITKINARMILDSRGNPTVEAEVWCTDGFGRAAVPSGASTGSHEAHELRDGEQAFSGQGVQKAIAHITGEIQTALVGLPADDQYRIDDTMIALDGTPNKSRLGANALLAVSLACAKAAADARHIPLFRHLNDVAHNPPLSLPMPMCNVLNGGRHANNSADFQEYMLVPVGASTYQHAIQITTEIYTTLKKLCHSQGFSTTVGDEGGFAIPVSNNTFMLDLLNEASTTAGYTPGTDVVYALDVAASEFFAAGSYKLAAEKRELSANEFINYLVSISKQYPIVSIEDGLGEDDWAAWEKLTLVLSHLQLVGDDLLVTNATRLEKAISAHAGNAILIKPNQIGTLTETIKTIALAREHNWNSIISHRSGETEDTTIAHLAVATGAGQIKTGSVARSDRTAKHNELLRIEDTHSELKLANPFITV